MNKLINIQNNENEILTINSREVAELIGRKHDNLLRDIRGYEKVLKDSSDLRSQDFFIESTYINSQNKVQPCFLLTKKGCSMVSNKITGEKGILFTATYINRFEEMENMLKSKSTSHISNLSSFIENKVNNEIERLSINYADLIRPLAKDKYQISKYIKNRLGIPKANNDYEIVKLRTLGILGATKWEDIPYDKLDKVYSLIDAAVDALTKTEAIKQTKWF